MTEIQALPNELVSMTWEQYRTMTALIKQLVDVLEKAPVYVTPVGAWLCFRPDPQSVMGSTMMRVIPPYEYAIRAWGLEAQAAIAAAKGNTKWA